MAVSQVLFLRALAMPISHNRCSHMTIDLFNRSILLVPYSRQMVPLPKFGLLARGVYPVPFLPFPEELRHCGTLRLLSAYPTRGLSVISSPSADKYSLLPTFADGTNTPGISAPGEPGLSSTHVNHEPQLLTISCLFCSSATRVNLSYMNIKSH